MPPTLQEQFAKEDAEIAKTEGHPTPVQKRDVEKTTFMPFRVGVVALYLIAFTGVGYVAYRGTLGVIHFFKGGSAPAAVANVFTPLSGRVAATTEPVPHNPAQKVVSSQNVVAISNSNANGQVSNDQALQNSSQKNQASPDPNCPDYLGDQFACIPNPPNY